MNDIKPTKLSILVSTLFLFVIVAYMGYNISNGSQKVFSISTLAIIAGLLFEGFRISDFEYWVDFIFSFFVLFIIFFHPFLLVGTPYCFYDADSTNVKIVPFFLIGFFSLFVGLSYLKNPTRQINEGLTLIQSLAVVYWIIDYNVFGIDNWYIKIGATFALFFASFALFNALTYYVLSDIVRVLLSTWSTIVMLFFAIQNMYSLYQAGFVDDTKYLLDNVQIGIQFFLVGISSIYVITNFFLLFFLFSFLPISTKHFYDATHFKGIQEIKDMHLARYTDQQIWIGHSILCIVVTGVFYWTNYHYQFLPRNAVIWVGLWLFPILFRIITFRQKKTTSNYYRK